MDSKLRQRLNDARVFSLAAQHMLPLVESWRQRSADELRAAFQAGHQEQIIIKVARYDAFTSILEEIQSKQIEFETLIDKHPKEL